MKSGGTLLEVSASDLWSSSVELEAVTILLLMAADSICTFLPPPL